jgi:hypothetical protein
MIEHYRERARSQALDFSRGSIGKEGWAVVAAFGRLEIRRKCANDVFEIVRVSTPVANALSQSLEIVQSLAGSVHRNYETVATAQ